MSGFNLQPTLISGLSDDVELGEIGEIKKGSVVVMRIRVDGGLDAGRGLHWRGIGLTMFDGKRWYNESHEPTTLTAGPPGWVCIPPRANPPPLAAEIGPFPILLQPPASPAVVLSHHADTVPRRLSGGR